MGAANGTPIGTLGWLDLTDERAPEVRDFYQSVVGFHTEPLSMGDYDDYVMKTADGETAVCGIVHKRGSNAEVPPGWIPYFVVADLAQSAAQVTSMGGELLGQAREYGSGAFQYVRDPS
ncbi:MAG: VOC family protein, partial [Pseudomonadota bacterium]